MALSRQKKEELLAELTKMFSDSKTASFMQNNGLSVDEIWSLRAQLRKEDIKLVVAKKTLIRKAAQAANVSGLDDLPLDWPVAVAFSFTDELAGPRVVYAYAKSSNKKAVLLGAILDSKAIGESEAVMLATLPPREQLLAKLMGSMKSPISWFVQVGSGVMRNFVSVLDQIAKKGA